MNNLGKQKTFIRSDKSSVCIFWSSLCCCHINLIRYGPEESSPNDKPPLGCCKGDTLPNKPNYISFAFDTDDGMSVGQECGLRIMTNGPVMHSALL